MLAFLLAFFQAIAVVSQPVTVLLDDDHVAADKILGYHWLLDSLPLPETVATRQPPCTACLERTLDLTLGAHRLVVTPYTATGDVPASSMSYDVTVAVTGTATDRTIHLTLRETVVIPPPPPPPPIVGFRVPEDGPSVKDRTGNTWTIGPQENVCDKAHPEWCHKIRKNGVHVAPIYGAGLYLSKAGVLYVIGDDHNYYVEDPKGAHGFSYFGPRSPD
jgi:hypothetical protein